MRPQNFAEDGCARHSAVLTRSGQQELLRLFLHLDARRPGHRLPPDALSGVAGISIVRSLVADLIGAAARPVRALLFDKRDGGNWALGWHQDRTIEVRERREVAGFGPWTVKQGRPHVAPPIALLDRMITARLHLDQVDDDNAPLIVAPGSHRLGVIAESRIDEVVTTLGQMRCHAAAGDAWLYATPILHASDRAAPGRRRRVVQIDFSADVLPGGLEWSDAA